MNDEKEMLEKEIEYYNQKCKDLSSSSNENEEKLTSILEALNEMKSSNEKLIHERNLLQMKTRTFETFDSKNPNETETSEEEELTQRLSETIQRHNMLENEVNFISGRCEQYNDPNFIFSLLCKYPTNILSLVLNTLNNKLIEYKHY